MVSVWCTQVFSIRVCTNPGTCTIIVVHTFSTSIHSFIHVHVKYCTWNMKCTVTWRWCRMEKWEVLWVCVLLIYSNWTTGIPVTKVYMCTVHIHVCMCGHMWMYVWYVNVQLCTNTFKNNLRSFKKIFKKTIQYTGNNNNVCLECRVIVFVHNVCTCCMSCVCHVLEYTCTCTTCTCKCGTN